MHHHPDAAMLESLLKLFAEGKLKLPHVETMPLRDAAEAHRQNWRHSVQLTYSRPQNKPSFQAAGDFSKHGQPN